MALNEKVKRITERFDQVRLFNKAEINNSIIQLILLETYSLGGIAFTQLDESDSHALFDFYINGLSDESRRLFPPYPILSTPPTSVEDLSAKIVNWKREDDWSFLNVYKNELIVGVGFLKRIRSEHVTSGLAVRENFRSRKLGRLLQSVINMQARLLGITEFHVKIISDNLPSIRLHENCGFKKVGVVPSETYGELLDYLHETRDKGDAKKREERHIIKMVVELSHSEIGP